MNSIKIVSNNKETLCISYSDISNFKHWLSIQRTKSWYLKNESDSVFLNEYTQWLQWYWNEIEQLGAFDLKTDANIIDIGSGLAVIDLLLAKKFPKSTITLVDKNLLDTENISLWGETHSYYNSWQPVLDGIFCSHIHSNQIRFKDPDDSWGINYDLVMSHHSWCWHYPASMYLDKVYHSLKLGGKLLLTVRFTENDDIVKIITEKFGTCCGFLPFKKDKQIDRERHLSTLHSEFYGGLGVWMKTI